MTLSTTLTADRPAPRGTATAVDRSNSRRGYIDWLRGLAILVMIQTHVLDSWTRAADRQSAAFGYAKVLGGFAAPLFLFLAGIAVVFATRAWLDRTGDLATAARAVQRRGWQIFGLAFLFRLQSFVLNPLSSPAQLLRVDILNIMGPALVLAAVLCGRTAHTRPRLFAFGIATGFMTFATPVIRDTSLLAFLPDPVEAYFRLLPGHVDFTLFPWAGFVFAGAFVGTLLDRQRTREENIALHARLAIVGLASAVASYYAWYLPSPYAHTEFWSTSPTFFFMRFGILVAAVGLIYFPQSAAPLTTLGRAKPMQRFGRSSLFVYWVHVEIVYGALSRRLHHHLSIGDAIAAFALFSLGMFALVVLKDGMKAWRKERRQGERENAALAAACPQ